MVKVYMPVVVASGVDGHTVQKTVEMPQMQFLVKVMEVLVISQRQVPGAADDVYGGGYGVWAVVKGLFFGWRFTPFFGLVAKGMTMSAPTAPPTSPKPKTPPVYASRSAPSSNSART